MKDKQNGWSIDLKDSNVVSAALRPQPEMFAVNERNLEKENLSRTEASDL